MPMKRWPLNKAYFWERAPFFRILLPLVVGIWFYNWAGPKAISFSTVLLVALTCFLSLAGIILAKKNTGLYRILLFSSVNILLFFAGYSASYYNDLRNNPAWFGNRLNNTSSFLARINDNPSEKEHSWKAPVIMLCSVADGKVDRVTGSAFLYVYKDGPPVQLHKGDSIWVPNNWQPIKNGGNPFEFDYAGYCRQNNLFYQQFCSADNIRLYAASDPGATPFIDRAHDWCMAQLENNITDPKTRGLIQAMLLGDEVNLDEDLRQSYSDTGIVHIIAISGGNVAIFFFVISYLLWWLRNKKHLWVKYAIALPLVWFYVVMAGSSPSAIRAAVMFTLLAFSVMLQKNNNSLNQLFATAFVLLCAQPMWLFSAGFQLSFVAVLSLVLFYAPVYKWVNPSRRIPRALWGVVAASIAAEVLVAPLVIYYFHTFPLLFVIANVIAYLFMSLVLILAIAIIALFFIPVAAKVIGLCTVWIVTWFDKIVTWLQGCNPMSFHFLTLTTSELILVYLAITGVTVFLLKKQKPALFMGLGALCLLLLSFGINGWVTMRQLRFVVYNTGKANQIELLRGNTYTVVSTDTSAAKKIAYATKPAHTCWRAWTQTPGLPDTSNQVFNIGGKKVLVLNREQNSVASFPVDYLIVNYTGAELPKLQQAFLPKQMVIGNNYTRKQQDKLVKESADAGINVHFTSRDGAFVLE